MFEFGRLDQQAYEGFLAEHGNDEAEAFAALVRPIVNRFYQQTQRPPLLDDTVRRYATVLWGVCARFGFPISLGDKEKGEAQEMDPDDLSELMTQVLDALGAIDPPTARMDLAILSNQLIKAVLQPEFKRCRMSYSQRNDSGTCERQNLRHCQRRISGSHCVDCPLFILTNPAKHPKVLKVQWNKQSQRELEANLDVFLPKDFRQLKYFLHLQRRAGAEVS